jgi:integrase
MSRRSRVFIPKKEPVVCPECDARLIVDYHANCAIYECSECNYKNTIWKELKEKKVRGPPNPKPKAKEHILTVQDIRKVNANITDYKQAFAFIVMLFTGLRVSEFIHMRKSWIDFKKDHIYIPDKQKCDCGKCMLNRIKLADMNYDNLNDHKKLIYDGYWLPKTESSARTIAYYFQAREVLQQFFKKHKSVLEVFPWPQYVNNTLNRLQRRVNKCPKCGKMSKLPKNQKQDTLSITCKNCGKRYNGIKIFPHCLRASFATMMATDKWDAYNLTDNMGWASIDVARSYILMSGEELSKEREERWKERKI